MPSVFPIANRFCMAFLYGRAGRLTAKNGGFRPPPGRRHEGAHPLRRPQRLAAGHGGLRARSHCRFVLLLIQFIPESLTYSVPLILKRQCNRTPRRTTSASRTLGAACRTRRRRRCRACLPLARWVLRPMHALELCPCARLTRWQLAFAVCHDGWRRRQ